MSHKKGLKKFAVIIWFYAKMFVSPDQRNLKIYDNFGTESLPSLLCYYVLPQKVQMQFKLHFCTLKPRYNEEVRQTLFVHYIK